MVRISNDDVVEDFDFEKLADSDEIAGDLMAVQPRRLYVSFLSRVMLG